MTLAKEEVEDKIELILDSDTGSDCTVLIEELLAHDAEQRQVIEQQAQQIATLKSELSQRTNLEGSAPCWNSAHMKQIATLREALEGMLFIFGHNDGYAQVKTAKQALEEVKE